MVKKNFLKSSLIIAIAAITMLAFLPKLEAASVPSFTGSAHIQTYSWKNSSASPSNSMKGAIFAGTEGQSKRVEAIKLNVINAPAGMELKYRAHVQGKGWMDWVDASQLAGTEGQSLRMEAFEVSVANATGYVVKYRAHVQGIGWMDWVTATNSAAEGNAVPEEGKYAGTIGKSLRMEAIEITILSADDNEIEEYKQDCLAELRNSFNALNYTEDKKTFDEEMEKGVKAILATSSKVDAADALNTAKSNITTKAKTNEQAAELVKGYKESARNAIKTFITTGKLNKVVRQDTNKSNTYENVPEIAVVLEEVDEIIESKKYDDLRTLDQREKNAIELETKIYEVTREYAKTLLEKLYNNGTAIGDDLVLTSEYKNKLEIYDTLSIASDEVAASDLKNVIGFMEGITVSSLKVQIKTFQNALDELKDSGKRVVVNKTLEDKGGDLGTRNAGDSPKCGTLPEVKNAIANGKKLLESAKSNDDLKNAVSTTQTNITKAVVRYLQNTINAMKVPNDVYEDVLMPNQLVNLNNSLTNCTFDTLISTIDEYNTLVSTLTAKED